ncbi:MAG: AAA family ATPase [Sphingopyxis sp.]|nr:AAA family ATPase [Sphingopyxis sp.]
MATLLFGRDAELAEAIGCFAAETTSLSFVGEAGIGKTQLARAVWNQLREDGVAGYWIECGARHRLRPLGAARELITALVRDACPPSDWSEMSRLRSIIEDAGVVPDSLSIADGLWLLDDRSPPLTADPAGNRIDRAARIQKLAFAIIASLTRERAILVAVDDVHLADRYSAELFDRLASAGSALRMLFTRRERDGEPGSRSQVRTARAIELRPIDRDAVARLVRYHAPSIDEQDVEHVLNLAGGNPFAARAGAGWAVQGGDAVDNLADILRHRIAALPRVDRLVLRIIAIAADAIATDRIDDILARLGQSASAADPVERLVAAGLVERTDRSLLYRPSHDLVRSAVRGEMSAGATVMAAEALARALRLDGPGSARWSEMAQQWELARNPRRAAQCYAYGAQAALDAGFAVAAAEMYTLAIGAAASVNLSTNFAASRWRARLAEAYWAAGELAQAGQAATLAATALRPFSRSDRGKRALVRAGSILSETGYFTGRIGDVLRGGSMATRYGGLQDARTLEHCRSNSTIAYVAGLVRLPLVPGILFGRAHRLAADNRDLRPEAYVRATEGILDMIFCRWSACDRQLARSMACLDDWPAERQLREVIVTAMGHSATFQGNLVSAEVRFAELGRLAAERENRLHLGWASYMLALIHLSSGKWEAASTEIEAARIWLAGSGDVLSDHIVAGLRARLLCEIGDDAAALEMAEAAGELSLATPPTNFSSLEGFSAPPLVGARLLHPEKGVSDRARRLVARYRPALRRFACLFPHARPRLATIDALVAANDRRPGAGRAARRARHRAATSGMLGELNLAETLLGSALPGD